MKGNYIRLIICKLYIWALICSKVVHGNNYLVTTNLRNTNSSSKTTTALCQKNKKDVQIEIIKQMIWENLKRVPNTERDYESIVKLRIVDGNYIDADCKLIFPASSWEIASIVVDDYQAVLKQTNIKIFEVIYRMISEPTISATEICFSGLWRPWKGSHLHIEGRGIDIRSIRSKGGSGVVFNYNISKAENDYAQQVRKSLTTNFPSITQYLSPWMMCKTSSTCTQNMGVNPDEKTHRDHLHLTLSK